MSSPMLGLQGNLGIFSSDLSSFSAQPSFDLKAAFPRHRDCDNDGESGRYHNDCRRDPQCDPRRDSWCEPLSVNGNTVNTGRYTITASTDGGGTLTVKDNYTGESFKVWGDPHITEDTGATTSFQNAPATFQLPDGTEITVDPTHNCGSAVQYIGKVTITKGNDAVEMTGFQGNLQTQTLPGEGHYLDATTPDGTVLTAKNGNIDQLELPDGTPIGNVKNIDNYANEAASPGQTNQLEHEIVQLEQQIVQLEQEIMQIESMNLASPFSTGCMSDPLEDSSFG